MEDSSIRRDGAKDTRSDARLKVVRNVKNGAVSSAEPDGPPDGFQFVLPFLDLPSRLNIEKVNKSLRESLKDPLVWADLRVEKRACRRLTEKILLKLVERAGGRLKSLFLENALEITDETLSIISELNPGLERISVPGCTQLTIENFVSLVEAHSLRAKFAKGLPGIRQVRIGRLDYILREHLLRLEDALGVAAKWLQDEKASRSRRYYGNREGLHRGAMDKRPVDVEVCPDCEHVGLIYDCTSCKKPIEEESRSKHRLEEDGCSDDTSSEDSASSEYSVLSERKEDFDDSSDDESRGKCCRACINCIPRCDECGTCGVEEDYWGDGLLCEDLLCTDCRVGDFPQCSICELYSCPRHEKDCFAYGLDRICVECCDSEKDREFACYGIPLDDDEEPDYLDWPYL